MSLIFDSFPGEGDGRDLYVSLPPQEAPSVHIDRAAGPSGACARSRRSGVTRDDWEVLIAAYDKYLKESGDKTTCAQLIAEYNERGWDGEASARGLALEHAVEKLVKKYGGHFGGT
jgi:hypothetical protein